MPTKTLDQLKREYYGTLLGYSAAVLATKTLTDLEFEFFTNPPAGGGGDPTMGGDLTGSASNAQIGAGTVGTTELANLAVTDGKVAAANKDGVAGTVSMRTLGTGAQQAAAGNHTHANMEVTTNKNQNNGYLGLDGAAKAAIAQLPTGTGGSEVALGNHTHANMEVTTNKNAANGYAGLTSGAILAIATAPAGSLHVVEKSGGVWPARPSTRIDIRVAFVGADPAPAVVTSPATNGMYNGDFHWVTP